MLKKNRRDLFLFFVWLLCLFTAADSYATKRYWVGTGSNKNWNSTGNWSATSGGSSGASVPATTDSAYFNGSGTGQCIVNATMNVKRLEIAAGYTDTIKQGTGIGVTIGTGGMVLSGGYFTGSNGGIICQGIFTLSGTNFKSTSGRLTVQGNFTVTSGTFTHNSGEVFFTGIFNISASITLYDCRFYPLSGVGGTFTLDTANTLNVDHLLTVSGAYLSTGKVHAKGDILQDGTNISSYLTNNGTIVIDGTGSQTFTGNSGYGVGAVCNVEINKPSGTLYLKNYIVIYGKWKHTAGTVDVSTYTNYLSFDYSTCSIEGTQTISNLILYPPSTGIVTLAVKAGDTLTVAGDMTVYGIAASTGSHTGAIKLLGNYNASSVSTSVNNGGSGVLIFCGTGNQDITGGSTQLAGGLANVIVEKPSGTLYLKNTITLNKDWTHISGTVDADTYTSTVIFPGNASRTVTGKTSFYNLTFHGNTTNTTTISTGDSLTVGNDLKYTGAFSITLTGGVIKAKGNITITNTATSGSGSTVVHVCGTSDQVFTGISAGQGRVSSVKIDKPGGTLTLKNTLTVMGDWYYLRGTVDASTYSSLVLFGAGTRTIQGSHSLYDVQLAGSSIAGINNIPAGDSLTVTGTLTLIGASNVTVNTGVINVKGDLTITNTSISNAAGTGIFNICGTGSQTLTGSGVANGGQLSHVHIRKPSGTLYLVNVFTIGAADWLYYSGTVDPGLSSTAAFSGNGNVNCKTGTTAMFFNNVTVIGGTRTQTGSLRLNGNLTITTSRTLDANGKDIRIGGDWKNDGAFTYAGSTVLFNGKGDQKIMKLSGTENFDTVIVRKNSGRVLLNCPVSPKALALTKGKIITTATNLFTMPDNGVCAGGSDSSYICGPFKKTGNDAFTFPLGDTLLATGAYHPLSITAPANTTDAFTANYYSVGQSYGSTIDTDSLESISNCEYWLLTRNTGTSVVVPSVGWNKNSCNIYDQYDICLAGWNGTKWTSFGKSGSTTYGIQSGILKGVRGLSLTAFPITIGSPIVKNITSECVLKKKLDASYYTLVGGLLKFKYNEEYVSNGVELEFTVYDKDRNIVLSNATPTPGVNLLAAYKDNRWALNVLALNPSMTSGYYVLEVKDKKGEISMLRFKI